MKKMKLIILIFFIICTAIISVFCFKYILEKQNLLNDYIFSLEKNEKIEINSIYCAKYKGVISYIKQYENNPFIYVISILNENKIEKTIGKVEITNFSKASIGDSIYKQMNTFNIQIKGKNGKFISKLVYK